jgi:hypothetical protein
MSDTKQNPAEATDNSPTSLPDIRIVGINTDKTRRLNGSDTRYHVYFQLSESPPQAWRDVFQQEWKALNPTKPELWQEASIDREFLVMHCPLSEIATVYLPVLKKAVAASNTAYRQFEQKQSAEQTRQEDVWKQERETVEDVAKTLRFD